MIQINDYGESDKVITMYSPDEGKFKVIAKGAKRSKKRFVNKLEPFSHLNIRFKKKYSLPIVEHAELVNSHICLREEYGSYLAGMLLCDLIKHWAQEGEEGTELFDCFVWALNELCNSANNQKIIILFLTKLYTVMGYQPDIRSCCSCKKLEAKLSPFSFRVGHGTIICSKCRQSTFPSVPLSISTVKLLSKAFELPLEKLSRLHFNKESTQEAINFFKSYDRYLLDKTLPSWKFI